MNEDTTQIQIEQFYPHPPHVVWKAITTPELMAKWLMPTDGFEPTPGQQFTMQGRPMPSTGFSGMISCEVLEAAKAQRLRISWNDTAVEQSVNWIVTWDIAAEDHGTRVILTHSGFDPGAPVQQRSREIMGKGWPGIAERLGTVLAELSERSEP